MNATRCALLVLLSLASAARAEPAASEATDRRSESAIRERLAAWVLATNAKDPSADDIWAAKLVGWFPSAPELNEAGAYAVAGLPSRKGATSSTFAIVIDEVAVSGSLAAVHDLWTETLHFAGSEVTVTRLIRGSELWRLQPDGKWRIARFVSAPDQWRKS